MDWIHTVLNIVAPPLTLLLLCLFLPLFWLPKLFISSLRSFFFTEDVAGKVVSITGAASGIGEQLAYQYARRRACLVLADIRGEILRKVADTCYEIGSPDAVTITADVSDVNDCKRIVDSAISHFGRLDHLVSNAGIISIEMVEDYEDITDARSVMDINFWGSVYITRFAIPHLRNAGGKIIAMASSASWSPVPKLSIYSASKAAMVAFYETLRVEVGSDINITIVTPGFIESKMIINEDALVSVFPMGKADTCAKAIVKSACRGERCLTEPAWYRVTYWLKMFAPELVGMFLRPLYLPKRAGSSITSLSNMIVNLPGLKAILHPSSMRSPEIKTE